MTRLDVRATVMVALKCRSSIKSVISAAMIRHIEGMKSDSTKFPGSLSMCIDKIIFLGVGFSM